MFVFISFTHVFATADYLDKLMKLCSEGDQQACAEIERLTETYEKQIERLNAQADFFQMDSNQLGIEHNGIPNLEKAYPIILKRYMNSDAVTPAHHRKGLNDKLVIICAKRFHNTFFIQGKEWPIKSSGRPDWGMIYLQAIEHYFRHCSREFDID